ncbi:unnamed protein product [Chrysodeixis includens]|uniref:Uncharacterized protein n=1 Tax=Chrysodeixis includens TaxID=689277 RepID=A0A9N8KXY0_CHRIL|nr:unnamed protein product [Chrysodeixis includens]
MAWELIIDADSKVNVVESFRKVHSNQREYQTGQLMATVRADFQKMIAIRDEAVNDMENGNSDEDRDAGRLAEMEILSREIDNDLSIIENSNNRKQKGPKSLRFLRNSEGEIIEHPMNTDDLDLKFIPSEDEEGGTGMKRVNQKWEAAVQNDFDK